MNVRFIVFTLAIFLVGCSEEHKQELNLTIPNGLPAEIKSLVEVGWPKVKAACPGLNNYASSLEFQGVEDNFSYASSKDAERVSVTFKVKENPSLVIGNYVANGHNCSFEISRDGSRLSVPKSPCASICEGRPIDTSDYKKAL